MSRAPERAPPCPQGLLEGFAATAHPAFVDELGGSLEEKRPYEHARVVGANKDTHTHTHTRFERIPNKPPTHPPQDLAWYKINYLMTA